MDNETPEGAQPQQRPESNTPLSNEALTARLFVQEKLLSMLLYAHSTRGLKEAGNYNLNGVQQIIGNMAGFLETQYKQQSQAFEDSAREYECSILGPLMGQLNFDISHSTNEGEQARDAAHAAILLDPDSGWGTKQ